MPADDEQIDISVVMHDLTSPTAENVDRKIKNIEDSADKAGGSVEGLGDKSEESSKQMDDLGKSTDKTHRKITRFDRMYQRFTRRFNRGNRYIAKHRAEVDKVGNSYDKARNKGQKFFTFGLNLGKMIGMIKLSALIEGLPIVATGLSAVGAGAVAAVAGLSPLVGITAALGPGMLALGSAIGVVKMATSGLGDAYKVLSDPEATAEEIAAAMKNLAPNAREFVRITMDLKEQWGGVREQVQNTFFKGLGPALRELNRDAMPMLKGHLVDISGVVNGIALDFLNMIGKRKNLRALDDVLSTNSKILANIGDMAVAGAELGLWITKAAGPMTRAMSGDFAEWLMGKSQSAQKNQDRLREFFNDSYELLKKVIDVTSDFAHGLYNIGRASAPLGRSLGKWFTSMGEGFRAWTENEDNFKRMQDFFREMRAPLRQFGKLVGALGEGFLTLAENDDGTTAGLFKRLRKDIVPNLVSALEQAQNGGVIDGILDLGEAFTKLIDSGFIGASAPIVKALGKLANAFADFFGALPEDMRTGIVGLMFLSSTLGKFRLGKVGGLGGLGLKGMLARGGGKMGLGGGGKFMGATPVYVVNMGGKGGLGGGAVVGGPGGKGGKWAGRLRGLGGPAMLGLGVAGAYAAGSDNKTVRNAGLAATGASLGSMFGPWGTAIGGAAGFGAGVVADGRAEWEFVDKGGSLMEMIKKFDELNSLMKTQKAAAEGASGSWNAYGGDAVATKIKMDKLNETFEKLAGQSLPEFKARLEQIPERIQTKMSTPGAKLSIQEVATLNDRLGDTPKEKQTALKMLGIDLSISEVKRLQAAMDMIRDKTIQIAVKARMDNLSRNLGIGGAGFGPQAPGAWTGAQTLSNKWYWTGEQGPEAFVQRNGKIRMLGMNGPELVKPGAGAVVNADATADPFGGDPNKSPAWAVAALQRAVGTGAQKGVESAADGLGGGSVTLQVGPIYPQTEMDVESAVRRAWSKIEKERRERS